jgi:MFS transporter, DHA2 family, multidrug resistance protein
MELFSDKPGDEGLQGQVRRLAMIAVMITTFMNVLDGSMINIALPQIASALNVSASSAIWVANGYLLSVAMTLIIFAGLAARVGFRRQFGFGLSVFTCASAGCALSSSLDTLIAMRVLQGIGGAATLSIAPAILRSIFPNRLLGRILGVNALLVAVSIAVAPVLGGGILSMFSWQWLFVINVPLGMISVALVFRAIPNQEELVQGSFDIFGAMTSAVMLGALILCANVFSHRTGDDSLSLSSLGTAAAYGVISLLAGLAFIWRQRNAKTPLLPLTIFDSSRFSLAALTSLISFISQGITFIVLPFLFESVYGYSAFLAALLFVPWPIGIALMAPNAGRLADRYPPAIISTIGLSVFVIGLVSLALLPGAPDHWDICIRSLICGIGFGLFQSPNNREMLANVSREHSSYASGILAIMRTFGQCLGAALTGVILSTQSQSGLGIIENRVAEMGVVRLSLWISVAVCLVAIAISFCRIRGKKISG